MRLAVRILLGLVIAFYAIPLLIITPLLNLLPAGYVDDHYGRTLETEWIVLNPFKLSLDIKRAALSEPDGSPFVSLADTSFNLSLSSLWEQGVVLDELRISDLRARVVRTGEDTFNFTDLIPPPGEEPPPPEPEDAGLPAVTVRVLAFQASELEVEDQTRDDPYESTWQGLDFQVTDLSTVIEEGRPYTLNVTGPEGGTLTWQGTISIVGERSEGSFSLDGLSMHNMWRVAQPWLPFTVPDGRFSFGADYAVGWGEPLSYSLGDGELAIDGLAIAPPDPGALPDTGVALDSLRITGIAADSATLAANIDQVAVDGLVVDGWSEGERVSLMDLFGAAGADPEPDPDPDPTTATAVEPPAEDAPTEPGWTAGIGRITMDGSAVNWRSEFTDPGEVAITPVALSVENVNWPLAGASPFTFSLAVNDAAALELSGAVDGGSGDGAVDFSLDGLPVAWFNPNLPDALNARLTAGELAVSGSVTLGEFSPGLIKLDGALTDFGITIQDGEEFKQGWDALRLVELQVDMDGRRVGLKTLGIDGLVGRLHIYEDGSINTSRVLQEEVGDEAEDVAEDLTEEGPWAFDVQNVILTDSSIDFMDQSLPIPFRTVIGDLNGGIKGMSSAPGTTAEVQIDGTVDGYSPVSLGGTVNPFADPLGLDLALSFSGVDMALLSPYSGTYAGYKIESGLLNLDLAYRLDNNQLAGNNQLRLDQLKLGEKIDSDKAIDAPLELAISIMTDSEGVIDMEVPVSGNVDDPSFALGSVISRAFIGIITKAVTAPFTLLANLVGSEEDLQLLNFPVGSATPSAAGEEKLDTLAAALAERPKLTLVVTGRVDRDGDTERMQKDALNASLLESGLTEADLDAKGDAWIAAVNKRYTQLPEADPADETINIRDKRMAVARTYPVDDAALAQLAEDRAVAVKTYLVNTAGLPADRAVIAQDDSPEEDNRFSGVELNVR